jgi:uncharacterized protein (TIGR02271 family)
MGKLFGKFDNKNNKEEPEDAFLYTPDANLKAEGVILNGPEVSSNVEDVDLNTKDNNSKIVDNKKILLRQEELDIAKNRVQIGQVELSKEIVEEQREVDVPVLREEVIIERKAVDSHPSDSPIGEEETIRIPVTEEQVEVGKHTVVTGEILAYKREVEENKKIVETLKKEEARVHKDGEPNIVGNETDYNLH